MLSYILLTATLEKILVASLFLRFKADGSADDLFRNMDLLYALSFFTSLSSLTMDIYTFLIDFYASSVKTLLSLIALHILALPNIWRNVSFIASFHP